MNARKPALPTIPVDHYERSNGGSWFTELGNIEQSWLSARWSKQRLRDGKGPGDRIRYGEEKPEIPGSGLPHTRHFRSRFKLLL